MLKHAARRCLASATTLILCALLLVSCGGGDTQVYYEFRVDNGAGKGVIIVTDSPHDELESFWLTVTEVLLVRANGRFEEAYFSPEGHRVDFLSLRGSEETRLYELLAIRDGIPSGVYERILVSVRDPEIVLHSGEVIDADRIRLADDGVIEIDLAEGFDVRRDETFFLLLDLDVLRSVEVDGQDLDWTVRPHVEVDVFRGDPASRLRTLIRVGGRVLARDHATASSVVSLPDGRGSLDVNVPTLSRDGMSIGQQVTFEGRFRGDGTFDASATLVDD